MKCRSLRGSSYAIASAIPPDKVGIACDCLLLPWVADQMAFQVWKSIHERATSAGLETLGGGQAVWLWRGRRMSPIPGVHKRVP